MIALSCSPVVVGVAVMHSWDPGPHPHACGETYSNDFDSGIGSDFSVINASGLFTVGYGWSLRGGSQTQRMTAQLKPMGVSPLASWSDFSLVRRLHPVTVASSPGSIVFLSRPTPGLNESILRCFQVARSVHTGSPGMDEFSLLHFHPTRAFRSTNVGRGPAEVLQHNNGFAWALSHNSREWIVESWLH